MQKTTLENKSYYTVAEIITAMRNEYQKSQQLLIRLQKSIEVDTNFDAEYYFYLWLTDEKNSKLLLKVSKKPSSIGELLRNAMNMYTYDEGRWIIDNATFGLTENSATPSFVQLNTTNPRAVFAPHVTIKNENEFTSIYTELKKIPLFLLPSLSIEINPYQNVHIFGDEIYFSNKDEKGKTIDIQYVANGDNITVKSNISYSTFFIERLLKTKIPKYDFPSEYISLLDRSLDKTSNLFIEDIIGRRKENLQFATARNKLVLTRKPKKSIKEN